MKKTKLMGGKVFVKTSKNSFITENSRTLKPIEETPVETYQVIKNIKYNRFELYQLNRRNKPTRVKIIKAKKGMTISSVVNDVRNDKFKFKIKREDKYKTKNGDLKQIQTNYLANLKSDPRTIRQTLPQLIAIIRVIDTRRKKEDYFVGISKKMARLRPNAFMLSKAEDECKSMAIGKFISIYGMARKSGDIVSTIVQRRYQYWQIKLKNK